MNAHADMLIIVGHNGLNTPGAFTAFLFWVCKNLLDFAHQNKR